MDIVMSSLLALTFAAAPPSTAHTTESPPASGPHGFFVDAGWRVMALGGHVSNGPAFSAGAYLFRYLEVGVMGFARPGPINPKTFDYALPAGQTYRGQSTLALRSDGGAMGLVVGPRYDITALNLTVDLPVMVGLGGFGFYLHGDDRETPDGRRVSAWEDELLGGEDSDPMNLVVDVGLRLAWRGDPQSNFRPYLSVHYTRVVGFDTTLSDDYSGVSAAVGVQFGIFPDAD